MWACGAGWLNNIWGCAKRVRCGEGCRAGLMRSGSSRPPDMDSGMERGGLALDFQEQKHWLFSLFC